MVVIQLQSLAFGAFAEVEPLNPLFVSGQPKLRITVDTEIEPSLPDEQLLQDLEAAFPGLAQHRCQMGREASGNGDARGILLLRRDSSANQAHLLEHLILEFTAPIDPAPRRSGVTCAYTSPTNRNDVFVECGEPQTGRLTTLLAVDALNAALAGRALAPHFPDATRCAALILRSARRRGAWESASLARAAGIPSERAASALEVLSRAGIAEREEFTINFSGEPQYRIAHLAAAPGAMELAPGRG